MNAHVDFMPLFNGEILKSNGTNFINWYRCLRNSLLKSNALLTIIEPLGPRPDIDVDEFEENAFHDRRDYYTLTEIAIINTIEPKMKSWFYNTDSDAMIGDLKKHFEPQVRLMVYDCLNEFYSLKMEEHT
jgi:hypothetical protein